MTAPDEMRERLGRVRLLGTDVDGVWTDGMLHYGERGEAGLAFHVRDGLGVRLLGACGVELAVVTARGSAALARRLQELGLRHYLPGREDKWNAVQEVMERLGLRPDEVAFVGDDLLDLPAMRRVGVAIAVADAHPLVAAEAHWVTRAAGGRGAIREVADAILESRGELDAACNALLSGERGR
jgi:3-deoxy-D-manno-octulosonate 8-phosphate phosphatase (KDO 8-P phosphatase)